MEKIVGLHIVFMFLMKALNLSQCSRSDTQISISVRMYVGNILNKYISVGLSHFGCQCGVLVLWYIFTHIVFITKLRGVVVFQKFIIFLWRMGQNDLSLLKYLYSIYCLQTSSRILISGYLALNIAINSRHSSKTWILCVTPLSSPFLLSYGPPTTI